MKQVSFARPEIDVMGMLLFVGERAMEVSRYSSNANFTVNLLCGYFGVDYYNIVEGPSNGMELLQFFEEALEKTYENGNPILCAGDAVVLDTEDSITQDMLKGSCMRCSSKCDYPIVSVTLLSRAKSM